MAVKTTNARLGIVGGISILGTTGIVRPFSTAAYRASVVQQIDRAIALINVGVFPSGTAIAGWFAANNVTFTTAGTASSGAATNSTTGPIGTTAVFATTGATRGIKMEIRADQLPSGYRWLQLQISVSSAAIPLFSAEVLGADPNYLPSSQFETTGYATGTTGSQIVAATLVS